MTTWAAICAETCRLGMMRRLEEWLGGVGYPLVAGVDEAGRGCLAGPVVAAAVIPDPDRLVPGIDDSKRLTEEQRTERAGRVRETALAWAVGVVDAETIDRTNILASTRRAMIEAVAGLDPAPDLVLIDAVRLEGLPCPSIPVIRGETWSYAIAAASILAKTERDAMLRRLDCEYPHYGFAGNKGYGSPDHLDALLEYGPSPVHRLTFGRVVPSVAERAFG